MPDKVTLDLSEWFGTALKVRKRDDIDVTQITIPNYLSKSLGYEDGQTVRIYLEKVQKTNA